MSESEKDRVIAAEVIVNAWKDEVYRRKLIDDPAGVLQGAGLTVPADCRITVLENTSTVSHIPIPSLEDMGADDKEQFMAELAQLIPVPGGFEMRLHQNTASERFLVLPLPLLPPLLTVRLVLPSRPSAPTTTMLPPLTLVPAIPAT